MANKHRGEVAAKLGAMDVTLVPSFEAQAQIEDITNGSMAKIAMRFMNRDIRIKDVAAIMYAANPSPSKPSFEETGETIFEDGVTRYIETVAKFFEAIFPKTDEPVDTDKKKTTETTQSE